LGICIAPTLPFRAALGAESRVYYLGNTADRQTQWVLMYYHLSQSTANQNGELIHCHRWNSNSWSSGCWRTSLTTRPSPTQICLERSPWRPEISGRIRQVAVKRRWPYRHTGLFSYFHVELRLDFRASASSIFNRRKDVGSTSK
jgi:hypothetical protein